MVNPSRRKQIHDAAIDLFDQRGFYGTGMEDIAKVVGIRASSMYNHYSSKQEVLGDISVSILESLLREHASSLAGLKNPKDRLEASMRNHVRFHAENAAQARVGNREVKTLSEPYLSIVRQLRRDYVQRWVSIIEEGAKAGTFHTEHPKVAAYFIIDLGTGVSNWFRKDGEHSLEDLCDYYAEAALRILKADS